MYSLKHLFSGDINPHHYVTHSATIFFFNVFKVVTDNKPIN